MTDQINDPGALLAQSKSWARAVRTDQRATWFALLVLAAVSFAAIPVDRYGHVAHTCRTLHNAGSSAGFSTTLQVCTVYTTASFVYWPIALTLAYAVIAAFYLRRGAARGIGTRVRPYVVVGFVLAVAFTAISVWWAHDPDPAGRHILGVALRPGDSILRIVGPAGAIGLGLLVLSFVERSVALLAVAVVYLAVVVQPTQLGWHFQRPSPWAFLPHLLAQALVLLIAGVAFLVAERRHRRAGA